MRSSNFVKQGKTEIGLKLVTRVLFPFLKIGVTQAVLRLPNAFSSSNSLRLMVLKRGPSL